MSSSEMNPFLLAVFLQEAVLREEETLLCFPCRLSSLGFCFLGALFFETCFYSIVTTLEITAVSYNFGYEKSLCSVFISSDGPFSHLLFFLLRDDARYLPPLCLLCVQLSEVRAERHTLLPGHPAPWSPVKGFCSVLMSHPFSNSYLCLPLPMSSWNFCEDFLMSTSLGRKLPLLL